MNLPQGLPNPPRPQKNPRSCLMAAGIGCAVMFVVFLIAMVVIVVNFKRFATNAVSLTAKAALEEAPFTDDEKKRLNVVIDRVAEDYKAGRISDQQLGDLMETLVGNKKLLIAGMCKGFVEKYVKPSDLSEERKQQAARIADRFARGVHEGTISEEQTQPVVNLMMEKDLAGQNKLRETLTREQLEAVLEAARKAADAAEVPDEPFTVDIVGEIEQAVRDQLSPPPAEAPLESSSTP